MLESVQNYYGKVLQHSNDLKTSACCDVSSMPDWLKHCWPSCTRR